MRNEIQENLLLKEFPWNCPDLLCHVFKAKVEMLKDELMKKHVLGHVAVCVYVIEFQKRGLPHAHFLRIMKQRSKPLNFEAYHRLVSAEIPDQPQSHIYILSF